MWKTYLKGVAMGAADIVPGVSGGTIAFISGIYERLISALGRIRPGLISIWRTQGFAAVWKDIDGTFLATLFAGILTSVFTLSRIISSLLQSHPNLIWAFFFGLILGSVWFVGKAIREKNALTALLIGLGAAVAYALTALSPTSLEPTYLNLFISGAIAICAMILPGVSGSFLLLLLGIYGPVLAAVKGFEILPLSIFASGCLIGLLSFTHLLSWLLRRYHDYTLAVLTGFMLGALNKVWPWKYTLEYRIDSHGAQVPLVQANVFPSRYEVITGEPAQVLTVAALFAIGALMVVALEKVRLGYQK
ncbi:DUF368 domain-containing protein [Hahella sp. KA22]|uniref:DUF368 domain-containing protein n=1 Tax=Hahella sp. KA22 TaxID=1628392 RepID=UPI000FDED5E9|nr:DUF368 domain-containing protein [Hahella sp. KA22]AZZ93617.1 DUF368 domain-containing protein [Hahella sp. KA22]QAY56991.1 DUF368 domain-containing protein [Hahella sp. KA22]